MGVFDGERRAYLCKHHFLGMKLDLRGGLATAVSLAYVGASVGYVGAKHISRNIEYYGDVGDFEIYACVFLNLLQFVLGISHGEVLNDWLLNR